MRYSLCALCFILIWISGQNDAAKILAVAPTLARSHFILQYPLFKALAAAGHEVTVLSPFPNKTPIPNYTDIDMSDVVKILEKKNDAMVKTSSSKIKTITRLVHTGIEMSEVILTAPNFQKLIHSNATFDVILLEVFMTDSMIGLGHVFNAPIVGISTLGATKFISDYVGNPSPPSYIPIPFMPFTSQMNFWERLVNTAFTYFGEIFIALVYHPKQEVIYDKVFPDPKPSYSEARKTSLALGLVNMHFSIGYSRPYVPNLIEVGGMHVSRQVTPLPQNIQDFIDSAKNGVIYFSLGSNLKPSNFDAKKRQIIVQTILKRKEHVIWKWDGEIPEVAGKKNILISKWLPQDDILRHPKIRLFITHGGLLSLTETIYHGIPVVGIPFFGDQSLNMAKAENAGYGKMCSFETITEESFSKAIDEVINNQIYKETIGEVSKRFRDKPMHPLDTAVYWVEYVIRHKGAKHMRSAAMDLNFIQLYSIDTLGFIFVAVLLSYLIVKFIIKKVLRFVFGSRSSIKKENKKKN